jgi:hypothetical protein
MVVPFKGARAMMAGNKFNWPKFEDHQVLAKDGTVVGMVRIKPSGLLWCPKGKHSWHRVTLEQFAQFAVEHGTQQKK